MFYSTLTFFFVFLTTLHGQTPVQVVTPGGVVVGFELPVVSPSGDFINTVSTFFGIPYSTSVEGANRWKASQVLTQLPLNPLGFFQADTPRVCIQFSGDIQTRALEREDCLAVNIYVPSGTVAGDNLPVLVWAHGGALAIGANIQWEGQNLVAYGGNRIIVVTVNYRLGALGFYPNVDLAAEDANGSNGGALGVGDLITALRWVQANIASFGGNPADVTWGGQSAGALLGNYLIYGEDIRNEGLIRQFLFQSGSGFEGFRPTPATDGLAFAAGVTLQAFQTTNLAVLRSLDPFLLVEALYGTEAAGLPLRFFWRLTDDGYYFPLNGEVNDAFTNIDDEDDVNAERILWSIVPTDTIYAKELLGTTFNPTQPTELTEEALDTYLANFISDSNTRDRLLKRYYRVRDYNSVRGWFEAINSDVCFICPTYSVNVVLEENVDTNLVFFRGNTDGSRIIHGGDLSFFFNSQTSASFFNVTLDEDVAIDYINFLTDYIVNTCVSGRCRLNRNNRIITSGGEALRSFGRTESVLDYAGDEQDMRRQFFRTYRRGACIYWRNTPAIERNALCRSLIV